MVSNVRDTAAYRSIGFVLQQAESGDKNSSWSPLRFFTFLLSPFFESDHSFQKWNGSVKTFST